MSSTAPSHCALTDSEIEVAQDDDASASTRASAAKDAVGDKAEEVKHKGL